MADRRALTLQNGAATEVSNADTVVVGAGIKAGTGEAMTAANIGTLTGGGNADALHTHAGSAPTGADATTATNQSATTGIAATDAATATNQSSTVGIAATDAAADTLRVHEFFRVPVATATALSAGLASGASPASLTTQPDHPRTLQVTTNVAWVSTDDVVVTINGIDQNGESVSDVITIPGGSPAATTVTGVFPFATVDVNGVSYTSPPGWTAGTFEVEAGGELGLLNTGTSITPYKEASSTELLPTKVNVAVGIVSAEGGYTPTTAIDGTNNIDVWYRVVGSHTHVLTDPGHNHIQDAHSHGITDGGHNHTQDPHTHTLS